MNNDNSLKTKEAIDVDLLILYGGVLKIMVRINLSKDEYIFYEGQQPERKEKFIYRRL